MRALFGGSARARPVAHVGGRAQEGWRVRTSDGEFQERAKFQERDGALWSAPSGACERAARCCARRCLRAGARERVGAGRSSTPRTLRGARRRAAPSSRATSSTAARSTTARCPSCSRPAPPDGPPCCWRSRTASRRCCWGRRRGVLPGMMAGKRSRPWAAIARCASWARRRRDCAAAPPAYFLGLTKSKQ